MPSTEAGKRLLDNLAAEYDNRHMEPYRISIEAIEHEARTKGISDMIERVESDIRRAEQNRLIDAVQQYHAGVDAWGQCGWEEEHLTAVLALVRNEQSQKFYEEQYMCPNCVTPWKCNGPHIP